MFKAPPVIERFSKILAEALPAFILVVATLLGFISVNVVFLQNVPEAIEVKMAVSQSAGATVPIAEVPHKVCATCHLPSGNLAVDTKSVQPSPKKPCIECHFGFPASYGNLSPSKGSGSSGHAAGNGVGDRRNAIRKWRLQER